MKNTFKIRKLRKKYYQWNKTLSCIRKSYVEPQVIMTLYGGYKWCFCNLIHLSFIFFHFILVSDNKCEQPPKVSHAKWIYEPDEQRDSPFERFSFTEGDKIQYYCETGYRLDGDPTVICQDSGRWSGQPICLETGKKRNIFNVLSNFFFIWHELWERLMII